MESNLTTASLPVHPSEVTPEWLTLCLQNSGALSQGRVVQVAIEAFAEGVGLLGHVVRLRPSYEGANAAAPQSLIAKFRSRSPQNVALCEAFGLYQREHSFYTGVAEETPLTTARLHASLLTAPSTFALVLEDVDRVLVGDQLVGATAAQLRLATKQIAAHHARFWGCARADGRAWLPPLSSPQIVGVLQHLLSGAASYVVDAFAHHFNDETRAVALGLSAAIPTLSETLSREPTTFVHGDFRIDNLLFGDGRTRAELTVLDWQICYQARGIYDVAYLMTQSVEAELRREIQDEILHTYHAELGAHDVHGYAFDTLYEDYRRATTYCLAYPLLATASLDLSNERGRVLAEMMLRRALSAVDDAAAYALLRAS
ncbi:MAG: hypothetical protein RL701_3581 [Pseudomonadota bacterium]